MTALEKIKPVVIVSEDEALVRMFTVDFLEDAGFEVLEAANADQALLVLEQHPNVQAIVTDIEMPGPMNGLELARQIRDRLPEIAILVVSGRVRPAPHQLPPGAKFLSKPVNVGAVLGFLDELMCGPRSGGKLTAGACDQESGRLPPGGSHG
jgi:two-component system, response regulator PdtaR